MHTRGAGGTAGGGALDALGSCCCPILFHGIGRAIGGASGGLIFAMASPTLPFLLTAARLGGGGTLGCFGFLFGLRSTRHVFFLLLRHHDDLDFFSHDDHPCKQFILKTQELTQNMRGPYIRSTCYICLMTLRLKVCGVHE